MTTEAKLYIAGLYPELIRKKFVSPPDEYQFAWETTTDVPEAKRGKMMTEQDWERWQPLTIEIFPGKESAAIGTILDRQSIILREAKGWEQYAQIAGVVAKRISNQLVKRTNPSQDNTLSDALQNVKALKIALEWLVSEMDDPTTAGRDLDHALIHAKEVLGSV